MEHSFDVRSLLTSSRRWIAPSAARLATMLSTPVLSAKTIVGLREACTSGVLFGQYCQVHPFFRASVKVWTWAWLISLHTLLKRLSLA